jgi:hypothetical protein
MRKKKGKSVMGGCGSGCCGTITTRWPKRRKGKVRGGRRVASCKVGNGPKMKNRSEELQMEGCEMEKKIARRNKPGRLKGGRKVRGRKVARWEVMR